MKHYFCQAEIDILLKYYKDRGIEHCFNLIKNKTSIQIRKKANALGLKLNPELAALSNLSRFEKPYNQYKVNPEPFFKPSTPEIAYLLGFLWADGYLNDNRSSQSITTSIKFDDGVELLKIFKLTGDWNSYECRTRNHTKKQLNIQTNNRPLFQFLKQMGYKDKNGQSFTKILSIVPDSLKHYFWRGYTDGDGCFYVKVNRSYEFSFSSCHHQDWSECIKLFDLLGLKWRIRKQVNKSGKGSAFIINRKDDVKAFGNYIYQGQQFGLQRKKDKWYLIHVN